MSLPRGYGGRRGVGRFFALGLAFACAGLSAGCFQPLYGTSAVEAPGAPPAVRTALASVEVMEIDAPNGTAEARLGVEVRNALIFGLTGGAGQLPPAYRLKINLTGSRQNVIVDITTARPDMEIYGIDTTYSLIEIASNKVVLTGRAFARQSYDIPGSSSGLPARAASATPRTARPRSWRNRSSRDSRRISSPAASAGGKRG